MNDQEIFHRYSIIFSVLLIVFGEYEGDENDDDEQDSEDEESINDKDLDASNNRKVFDIMMTNLNNGANKYGYSNKDGDRRKNKPGQRRYENNNDANQDDRRQSKRLKNDRKRGNGYFHNSSSSKILLYLCFEMTLIMNKSIY